MVKAKSTHTRRPVAITTKRTARGLLVRSGVAFGMNVARAFLPFRSVSKSRNYITIIPPSHYTPWECCKAIPLLHVTFAANHYVDFPVLGVSVAMNGYDPLDDEPV